MRTMNRVLIVDDHALFRGALRDYLSQEPDFRIVGEAGNMREAIKSIGILLPHLVLTDLSMPDTHGIEAVTEIKRHYPGVKVLVISSHGEKEYKQLCRKAGASGYIMKDAIDDKLRDSIRAVLNGKNSPNAEASGVARLNNSIDAAAAGEDPAYLLH